ncbi:hypothetical protein [Microcoleus sp. LEGE 07076]|nr:hypothetical protein [Microcoleus sp. LEGE 07076]
MPDKWNDEDFFPGKAIEFWAIPYPALHRTGRVRFTHFLSSVALR